MKHSELRQLIREEVRDIMFMNEGNSLEDFVNQYIDEIESKLKIKNIDDIVLADEEGEDMQFIVIVDNDNEVMYHLAFNKEALSHLEEPEALNTMKPIKINGKSLYYVKGEG